MQAEPVGGALQAARRRRLEGIDEDLLGDAAAAAGQRCLRIREAGLCRHHGLRAGQHHGPQALEGVGRDEIRIVRQRRLEAGAGFRTVCCDRQDGGLEGLHGLGAGRCMLPGESIDDHLLLLAGPTLRIRGVSGSPDIRASGQNFRSRARETRFCDQPRRAGRRTSRAECRRERPRPPGLFEAEEAC